MFRHFGSFKSNLTVKIPLTAWNLLEADPVESSHGHEGADCSDAHSVAGAIHHRVGRSVERIAEDLLASRLRIAPHARSRLFRVLDAGNGGRANRVVVGVANVTKKEKNST